LSWPAGLSLLMRIWSIHPKYLDSKGLVALWRETLLAKSVLENKTKGYRNHPQLQRFKEAKNSLHCINQYLAGVLEEAVKRNFSFNKDKIKWGFETSIIPVTKSQLAFEMEHLKNKLRTRDRAKLKEILAAKTIASHPLFNIIQGKIEAWEKV